MGKTGEDADASSVTMKKKSKKIKIEISDLSDVDGEVSSKKDKENKRKRKSSKQIKGILVEVFPSLDTEPENQTTKGGGIIRGKRFTPEEDEIIKDAVKNYITDNNLGEDGLMTVMNCSSRRLKKRWQEIGKCLPHRPNTAVYSRAHILFGRPETKGLTPEENETLKELHKKYANKWKKIDMRNGWENLS